MTGTRQDAAMSPHRPAPGGPARIAATCVLLLLAPAALGACAGAGPGAGGAGREGAAEVPQEAGGRPAARLGAGRAVDIQALTPGDMVEMQRAWRLFVEQDPRWPAARATWVAKGPAARQVLAENLFRYFWSASTLMRKDGVLRVGQEVSHVPEEGTLLFGELLALERWPLREATQALVFDPDNATRPGVATYTHLGIDDMTRQYAAMVLAVAGPASVPVLSRPEILGGPRPVARTQAYYALGTIGNDAALAVLQRELASARDWQQRGAAVKALGLAMPRNPAARPLVEGCLADPDPFVRRKAEEALAGRTRWEM